MGRVENPRRQADARCGSCGFTGGWPTGKFRIVAVRAVRVVQPYNSYAGSGLVGVLP